MNNSELENIARAIVSNAIGAGQEVQMPWAVHELIQSQGTIEGGGVPFYRLCAQEHAYRVIKKVVDKYENKLAEDDKQMDLEGFDCLQKAYTFDRDGERVLVPIDLISSVELLQRAEEYDRQSVTMARHAEQLRLFVAKRQERMAVAK